MLGFPGDAVVKILLPVQNTQVQSLGQEVPLEEEIATPSSILGLPWWLTIKNPPAMWETWVRSLSWEAALGKGMANHSSFLAWRSPMDRGAWQTTVHGVTKN